MTLHTVSQRPYLVKQPPHNKRQQYCSAKRFKNRLKNSPSLVKRLPLNSSQHRYSAKRAPYNQHHCLVKLPLPHNQHQHQHPYSENRQTKILYSAKRAHWHSKHQHRSLENQFRNRHNNLRYLENRLWFNNSQFRFLVKQSSTKRTTRLVQ